MSTSQIGIKIGVEGAVQAQADLRLVAQATQGMASTMTTVGQAMSNYTQMTRDARVEANLLRQANRQLAMQMTDVVTSLASGMPAWMVFIQQGGQIRDAYGGIGKAIQAVGGFLRTLINPLSVAAAGVATLGAAAFLGAREMDAYVKALTLSGNAAGTTAGALDQMAERIGAVAGTQGRAAEVLAGLAASGDIAASALEDVTRAAIELERAGGPAAEETAKRFAALGKEPLAAAVKFNEQTRFLTLSVYEQIKALESQGLTAEATAVATTAALAKTQESTKTLEGRLGYLEKSWRFVGDAAKGAWDAMLGLGRATQTSPEEQLASVQASLARRIAAQGAARTDNRASYQPGIDALRMQEGLLKQQIQMQAWSLALSKEQQAVVQARAEWDKEASKYLTDQERLTKAITEARQQGLAAGVNEAAIQQRIAAIRASFAKGGPTELEREAKATAEALKTREKYLETMTASAAKMAQENQALADQVKQVLMGKDAYQELIDLREEEQAVLLETQAIRALDRNLDQKEFEALKGQAAGIRERIALRRALTQANAEAIDKAIMARRTGLLDQDAAEIADTKRLNSAQEIVAAIERETAALNMSNVERETAVALLELERLGIEKGTYAYDEYAKKIRDAIVNRDTVRSSIKQAEDIQREWQRTADQIGQSLSDALMQGGKSAWEYIKGLFRSMVLRPVIQAIVNPVAGMLAGGSPGSSAMGALGGINSLATLGSAITGSFTSSIANVIGTAGSMFGSSALTAFSTGMRGATLAPGLMGPTTAGAGGAMGAGASVAAAVPYVAAALAVANALGVFRSRSIVGGGLIGTLGMGNIESYDLQRRGGTLFSGPSYSLVNRAASPESAAIQSAFDALRTNAASMAEALGLSSTAVKTFTTTLGTDIVQNDIGVRGIKLDGLTAEQAAQKVQEALNSANEQLAAFVLGLDGTSGALGRTGETSVQTLTRLASSIAAINPVLETLNLKLYDTSLTGADLASQLADAFGGLEAFQQQSSAYYQEFFSEAERAANTTEQLTKALGGLGLALPTTREQFRALVEAQDLSTEAGRKAFATLVGLSGTFAQLVPAVQAVEEAATGATQALRSAADILRERDGLERQLLQLQGDTAALRALDRAALDESNRALYDRIIALQDSQAAEAAAAEATRVAAAQAQAIAQQRDSLLQQLYTLRGDTATLRERERAALDASNRALFDHINALRDMQTASEAASQALREAAQARQRDADTARSGTDAALAAVRSAVEAQTAAAEAELTAAYDLLIEGIERQKLAATATRQAAQETLQAARGIFEYLGDQIDQLRGTAGAGMTSAQGRAAIQSAIAVARATGALPDQDSLAKAVAAARGGLDSSRFVTSVDQRRATLLLAQDLADLQEVAGTQATVAEQALQVAEDQLKALKDAADQAEKQHRASLAALRESSAQQIAAAQAQVDELRGVNNSVLTLGAALQALAAAVRTERNAVAAATTAQAAAATAPGTATPSAQSPAAVKRTMANLPADWATRSPAARIDWFNDQKITVAELTAAGVSWEEIQWMMNQPNGYKGFASGGMHMGGLRLVGERGPELEVTGPARIFSYEQTRDMLGGGQRREEALVAEIRALRAELEGLRAETRATAVNTNKTARILERVTPDGASLQTVPAP